MGYKLKRATMRVNGVEKQVRPKKGLPAEYQKVEWIQSDGSSYIRTSLILQDGYTFKMKVQYKQNSKWYNIGGYYYNSSNSRFYYGRNDGNQFGYGFGTDIGNLGASLIDTDYEIDAKLANGSQHFIVNGATLHTGTFSFSTSAQYPLGIFAEVWDVGGIGAGGPLRMYYCQLYDSLDVISLDLVPCYRKADGVIGMYDLVNDVFYTNSGTGTFTKGPDV